jgi:NAD(P)-dependent dehydrogenase (short-subunit alcohol dehydrogenase family)
MHGRTAIITGGSRGIGLGAARAMLDRGANVCLTARKEDGLAAARAELDGGDRVLTFAGHGGDPAHRAAAVAAAIERFESVDVLVNNAAINPFYGKLMDIDLDLARKTMDMNVVAAIGWSQEVHRAWMGENGGSIVNVASVGGRRASANLGIYSTSKAALIHLTENLALELAPDVRVNAVAPGLVKTDFAAALWKEQEQRVSALFPLARLGTIEDIGAAIAFLASDDSGWITGQTLVIDGGLLLTSTSDNDSAEG